MHNVYGTHHIDHMIVGDRHRKLVDHKFRKPPGHLHSVLSKLHAYKWHRHWKHVVLVNGGTQYFCDDYCDFDVPTDEVYGDFVEAVQEANAQYDGGPYDPAAPEGTLHGWNRAAAILQKAADEDDLAVKCGGPAMATIAQPDERIDVEVVDDAQVTR